MKKINILTIALLFVFTTIVFGQDISGGRIYAAQGNDFVILRDGKRILYNSDRLNEGPIDFLEGDIFQTGQESSADIQFGENGPLLKIVENSSMGFVGHGSGMPLLALNLFYGRIRVRNADGGPAVQVSSQNGLVEVVKGDIGIDYIVRNDLVTLQPRNYSSPVLYVTNFAGETSIFPTNDGVAVSALPHVLVREGETVSVEFVSNLSYVERSSVESTTADFWQAYDFAPIPYSPTAIAGVPDPGVEEAPPPDAVPPEEILPDEAAVSSTVEEIPFSLPVKNVEYETVFKRKNSAFLAGLIFLAGGLALEGAGLYEQWAGDADRGYYFSLSGMLVSGIGAGTLIHGMTIKLNE